MRRTAQGGTRAAGRCSHSGARDFAIASTPESVYAVIVAICIARMRISWAGRMAGISLDCFSGFSAAHSVLLGYAPACVLQAASFADVLDEDSGRGYQRRLNVPHSLDFRRYIQREGSATVALTFNLRPRDDGAWRVEQLGGRSVRLHLAASAGRVMSQVDCQHRLGHLSDLALELPFMCFVGLTPVEEMAVFNVINSKARGLSSSLLDFHEAQLAEDVAVDRPELYVALCLRNDPASPWYRQLDLGGHPTSGLARRASLRTMQKAVKVFLARTRLAKEAPPEAVARLVIEFWSTVAVAFQAAWARPRKHLLTKGIGVYAMMEIAADLYSEAPPEAAGRRRHFDAALSHLAHVFDWAAEGPLRGLGGEGGVKAAVDMIRRSRACGMGTTANG